MTSHALSVLQCACQQTGERNTCLTCSFTCSSSVHPAAVTQSRDSPLIAPPPPHLCRTWTLLHGPPEPCPVPAAHAPRKSGGESSPVRPVRPVPSLHSNAVSPLLHEDGCLDCFHFIAPLRSGLTQLGSVRLSGPAAPGREPTGSCSGSPHRSC